MIDLPALPMFTGKGLFGVLLKEGAFHLDGPPRQTIYLVFSPPKPQLLGRPLAVSVTGDARLVEFVPPKDLLKAGETFQFEIEWVAKKQAFDEGAQLSAEYLVKLDVIAPARMMAR